MREIEKFLRKYGNQQNSRKIEAVVGLWIQEEQIKSLLEARVGNGILVCDILLNPDIRHDGVSPELLEGFKALMKSKVHNYTEVHDYLLQCAKDGPEAFGGLLNKIQGQIGENQFAHFVGSHAHAASSGSQEAWDFMVRHGSHEQYVQVKVYASVAKAMAAAHEVSQKVAAGAVKGYDGIKAVKQVDFAVNDDIFDEFSKRVREEKLNISVQKIGATRSQVQESLNHAKDRVLDHGPLHNYFSDLFKGTLVGVALVGAVNGFLLWRGDKTLEGALEDTIYDSALTTGGVAAALAGRAAMGGVLGPAGLVASLGLAMGTRSVMKRFFARRGARGRLEEDNRELASLISIVEQA